MPRRGFVTGVAVGTKGSLAAPWIQRQMGKRGAEMGQDPSAFPRLPGHSLAPCQTRTSQARSPPGAQSPPCPLEIWGSVGMDGAGPGTRFLSRWSCGSGPHLGPLYLHPPISMRIHVQTDTQSTSQGRGTCSSGGGGVCGSCGT